VVRGIEQGGSELTSRHHDSVGPTSEKCLLGPPLIKGRMLRGVRIGMSAVYLSVQISAT
jgi:hypothetical protein